MEWFWFALAGPILWGAANLMDKYLLDKYVKNPFGYQIILGITDIPVIVFLLAFFTISFNPGLAFVGMITGAMVLFSFVLYNKALMVEEVSRVMTVFYINPLFIVLFAFILLDETLSLFKYFGIILFVISAILVSYKRVRGKVVLSKALFITIAVAIATAGFAVITKWALINFNYDYISVLFWNFVGAILGMIIMLGSKSLRKETIKLIKVRKVMLVKQTITIISTVGFALSFIAMTLAPVSLVGAIPSVQPLFVLIYALILSLFFPYIYKEKFTRKTILVKASAVILIIVGSILVII